jgi:hypothetical protein
MEVHDGSGDTTTKAFYIKKEFGRAEFQSGTVKETSR